MATKNFLVSAYYRGWLVAPTGHLIAYCQNLLASQQHTAALLLRYARVPDVWPHLRVALERLGCVPKDTWVMMHIPIELITQSVPDLPGFSFNWNIKEPQLEWELTAQTQETLAGECFAWGIPTHFRENANFDEWITFEWVGVEEPYRRRGLARRLMLEQMLFHYQRGVRNVMLWVEVDNLPARSLYESLGFLYGPECATFELHLFEDHDGQTESI
jgi:GNAT superfamily N-acetyltransferase